MNDTNFETTRVLGVPYAELDYDSASDLITSWAMGREHRYVVVAPVSSLMFARASASLGQVFASASMIASDGVPIVWARRALGRRDASRLYGPDLMLATLAKCQRRAVPVALVGGQPGRLEGLAREITRRFPCVKVSHRSSPPFRDLSDAEVTDLAQSIRNSGARVTFVGIGSPKQEYLMARLQPHLPGVQIGVGAAFDFIPGYARQAPSVLQRCGLEWAFRVACEPRRLWKRYATTIPAFVAAVSAQIVTSRIAGLRSGSRSLA